ncbi:MAG: NAD-binding protein [Eubacteriales bacterium]|nr:NAD-binding protein [Eubacteriales bacterium]
MVRSEDRRKLIFIIISISSLITVGTIGYMFLLDVNFIDALYMTVITISTVGYKEVSVMTDSAQLFSILIILWGLATVGYAFSTLVVMIVDGKIRDMWRSRILEKKIEKIDKHYIICGTKGAALSAIRQMKKEGRLFVVITEEQEEYMKMLDKDVLCILGESTEAEVLQSAGIDRAIGLISARRTDTENIVTVLTARHLRSDMLIISEVIEESAADKLVRAGANNTVSVAEIGGRRMAGIMTRPSVISFLDVTTKMGNIELDLEDIVVNPGCLIHGKNLKELRIPDVTGLNVLAIEKCNECAIQFNPDPNYTFEPGDILLVLGTAEQVNKLRLMADDDGNRLPEIK